MELFDIIQRLTQQPSPSGFEQSAQKVVQNLIKPYVESTYFDIHGNLIGLKKSKSCNHAKTLMLIAHIDEIGLMISHIEDTGYIRFTKIGGVDTTILKGREVFILHNGEKIPGVIGSKPIHMKDRDDKDIDISDLWIDIGANDRDDALKYVAIGDAIVLDTISRQMLNGLISGRGYDDKIGVTVLIKLLETLLDEDLDVNVVFVFSVQEEVGLRGAITSSYSVNPDICIALDVAHATDYPSVKKAKYGDIHLNQGVVIPFGTDLTPSIQKEFIKLAKEKAIPYQIAAQPGATGTDIHAVQVSRGGCVSGLVGLPCRYMHTPAETVSLSDMENAVQLLTFFCSINPDLYV